MPANPPPPSYGSDRDRYGPGPAGDGDRDDGVPDEMDWFGSHGTSAGSDPFADLRPADRTSGSAPVDRYADRVEYGDDNRYPPVGRPGYDAPAGGTADPGAEPADQDSDRFRYFEPAGRPHPGPDPGSGPPPLGPAHPGPPPPGPGRPGPPSPGPARSDGPPRPGFPEPPDPERWRPDPRPSRHDPRGDDPADPFDFVELPYPTWREPGRPGGAPPRYTDHAPTGGPPRYAEDAPTGGLPRYAEDAPTGGLPPYRDEAPPGGVPRHPEAAPGGGLPRYTDQAPPGGLPPYAGGEPPGGVPGYPDEVSTGALPRYRDGDGSAERGEDLGAPRYPGARFAGYAGDDAGTGVLPRYADETPSGGPDRPYGEPGGGYGDPSSPYPGPTGRFGAHGDEPADATGGFDAPAAYPAHPVAGRPGDAYPDGAYPPGAYPPDGYPGDVGGAPAGPWPAEAYQGAGGPRGSGAEPVPAGSRLVSMATAGVSLVLFGAVGAGIQLGRTVELAACVLVQLVFVLSWTVGGRRPGPWVVGVVGVACGLVADGYAAFGPGTVLDPFGYVIAGGILAGFAGQLARGAGRSNVTESLGATVVAVLGAVSVPTLLVLFRHAHSAPVLTTTVAAGGAAVVMARLLDAVWPAPRASLRVPRGAVGMAAGGVIASAAVGYLAGVSGDLVSWRAAVCGLAVGLTAVLADVGISFGLAGREISGEPPARWPAHILLGPAAAVAVAALSSYVLGVLVLLRA